MTIGRTDHEILLNIENKILEILSKLKATPPEPPTPEPPPEPTIPYPHLDRVVMRKDAPIMEVSHYNNSDVPVLRRHKKVTDGKLIIAKEGKKLIVLAKIKIDGYRNYAFRLISDQAVDGASLPLSNTRHKNKAGQIDGYLYIQKRLVKVL